MKIALLGIVVAAVASAASSSPFCPQYHPIKGPTPSPVNQFMTVTFMLTLSGLNTVMFLLDGNVYDPSGPLLDRTGILGLG